MINKALIIKVVNRQMGRLTYQSRPWQRESQLVKIISYRLVLLSCLNNNDKCISISNIYHVILLSKRKYFCETNEDAGQRNCNINHNNIEKQKFA